jgi:uracil-DNA glycosylase
MNEKIASIIKEIISCPNIDGYYKNKKDNCYEIISSQKSNKNEFQLPEPFSGEIDKAEILIISSNPSIDLKKKEIYPTYLWNESDIINFFYNRFKKYIKDGIKVLRKDGTHSEFIRYYSGIKARINEILQKIDKQKKVVPGIDYCLTEIVHCKSQEEIGVSDAAKCCSKYLKKIIQLSPAHLLIVVGKNAKELFCEQYGLKNYLNQKVCGPEIIENIGRMIYFIPAPNARSYKKLKEYLNDSEKDKLIDWVKKP